jgi:hypothetical protein
MSSNNTINTDVNTHAPSARTCLPPVMVSVMRYGGTSRIRLVHLEPDGERLVVYLERGHHGTFDLQY